MDSYAEFFVHKVKKMKSLMSTTSNNQDDELGIGGLSGEQLRQLQVLDGSFHSYLMALSYSNDNLSIRTTTATRQVYAFML